MDVKDLHANRGQDHCSSSVPTVSRDIESANPGQLTAALDNREGAWLSQLILVAESGDQAALENELQHEEYTPELLNAGLWAIVGKAGRAGTKYILW